MARVTDMVSVARSGIENLRPEEVRSELEDSSVLLVDVREPAETATGTIEGAALIPRGVLEFRADPAGPDHRVELWPDRRVILCSATGLRSALAARTLQELGYTDVAHLVGGITAWHRAGFSLTC